MAGFEMLFAVAVLIMSVVIHEVSHGYSAYLLGDPTAKHADRLTLNPFKHLDLFGSFIIPLMFVLSGSKFVLGWAKPVPYNPYNLKSQKWGPAIVGISGPASNLLVAVFFGLILRFSSYFMFLPGTFFEVASLVVFINILLAVFNLVPIPPLDGSKVIQPFLPSGVQQQLRIWGHEWRVFFSRYWIFILFFFIFFGWRIFALLFSFLLPIISLLFSLITGMSI